MLLVKSCLDLEHSPKAQVFQEWSLARDVVGHLEGGVWQRN